MTESCYHVTQLQLRLGRCWEADLVDASTEVPPARQERAFWMTVRAALIMVIRAIERRYGLRAWAAGLDARTDHGDG